MPSSEVNWLVRLLKTSSSTARKEGGDQDPGSRKSKNTAASLSEASPSKQQPVKAADGWPRTSAPLMSNSTRNVLLPVASMADNLAELHCRTAARGSMLLERLFLFFVFFFCCFL